MLTLYHLFSGTAPSELAGVEPVLQEAQANYLAEARRVVLVGNSISRTANWAARCAFLPSLC